MKLLDRYVLRNFLEPFLICFFGFIGIWLIFDFTDNGSDFVQAHVSVKTIAIFYATQLPQIILISLPVGLLLAVLFSFSGMSRRNEIISMLTAGRSVQRIVLPLIGAGLLASGLLLWLNYDLAPHAEAIKKIALEQIGRGRKPGEVEAINGYLFRDRMEGRTWYIRRFRPGSNMLEGVHITQQDAAGHITRRWYARAAVYDPRTETWSLNKGRIVDFDETGQSKESENFLNEFRVIHDWKGTTPARIGSAHQEAQNLTVPQLRAYLDFNRDFPAAQLAPFRTYLHHRLAVPFQCLVVILTAAPLAIVFSRRGVLGGVAAAMLLYAGLLLSTFLFLALGKGHRLDPMLAAWIPNGLFLIVGVTLLYLRGSNREIKLRFWK